MKKVLSVLVTTILLMMVTMFATGAIDFSKEQAGTVNPSAESVVATVYTEIDYGGDEITLSYGTFKKQMLDMNNGKYIRSIKINTSNPLIVYMFNSDNFEGHYISVSKDTSDLDSIFKYKIQSIAALWDKGFNPTPTPTPSPSPTPTPNDDPTPTPTEPPIVPPTGAGGMDESVALLVLVLITSIVIYVAVKKKQ